MFSLLKYNKKMFVKSKNKWLNIPVYKFCCLFFQLLSERKDKNGYDNICLKKFSLRVFMFVLCRQTEYRLNVTLEKNMTLKRNSPKFYKFWDYIKDEGFLIVWQSALIRIIADIDHTPPNHIFWVILRNLLRGPVVCLKKIM